MCQEQTASRIVYVDYMCVYSNCYHIGGLGVNDCVLK